MEEIAGSREVIGKAYSSATIDYPLTNYQPLTEPTMKHYPTPQGLRLLFCLLILLVFFLGQGEKLTAQPIVDTAAPRVTLYGIGDDEFPIYAWTQKWVQQGSSSYRRNLKYLWPYADSMGFNVLWVSIGNPFNNSYVADLHNSPYRDPARHRMRVNSDYLREAAFSRAIQFYPFDSVQSPYTVWKFTAVDGGDTALNLFELNGDGKPLQEKIYENLSDTGLIASGISLFYDPAEGRKIEKFTPWFTEQKGWGKFGVPEPHTSYVALTGHLYDSLNVNNNDATPVFTVAVYHEIPNGRHYLDASSTVVTAGAGGAEYLVDSFAVTRGELREGFPGIAPEFYRTIAHGVDFRSRYGGGPGPLHPMQPHGKEQSVDIRVYWTGKEKAALRSVELRDSIAHLLLGVGAPPTAFRKTLMDHAKLIMLGSASGNIADLRTEIVALELATESNFRPMEFAGFQALHRMLRDTFNLPRWRAANGLPQNPMPGDSIGGQQFELADRHFHRLTTQDVIHTYNYFNDLYDTLSTFGEYFHWFWNTHPALARRAPHHTLPAFTQMNGGRFHLPVLLDLDSVQSPTYKPTLEGRIEDYETTLQRIYHGKNDPGNAAFYSFPRNVLKAKLDAIGNAARLSRSTGRRYVPVIGVVTYLLMRDSTLTYTYEYDTTVVVDQGDTTLVIDSTFIPLTPGVDTIATHNPNESELFGTVGLSLAYGATGVFWYSLGNYPAAEQVTKYRNDTIYKTIDYGCCWGAGGFFTGDTLDNVFRPLELHLNDGFYPSTIVSTIPNVYMGWREQTRAVKRIDRWLQTIGPELAKLRWRDAYSIHYTVPWYGDTVDTLARPLPGNEIIMQVTSRSPFKTKPDSAHRTFVELGLFDKLTDSTDGTYDPFKDVHHIFINNRRAFRKPKDTCWSGYCDVTYEDKSVTILDTLAGTRIISCRLNLTHSDPNGYNYWHVREVEPDTEPLPHEPLTARHVLDTVIAGDSVFSLVLGPGKSSLIRIQPARPDTTIVAGDLRWPGQRKLIHDGKRFHAVYHKTRSLPGGGTDNVVVWRWSYPVTDTVGAVLWAPTAEVVLSDSLLPGESARTDNRFPSVTLRRIADSTWMTVVWTCHPNASGHTGEREVVARNLRVTDIIQPYPYQEIIGYNASTIYTVDYHKGTTAELWGTPAISFTHGSAMIAWSDSTLGIVGRLFPLTLSSWIWPFPMPVLSARDSISWPERQTYGFAGQYPTLPPWTPTARTDSSVGISWRQPSVSYDDILYQRVRHTAGGTMMNMKPAALVLSPWLGKRWYPSMDVVQDIGGSDHNEGVVWEDDFNGLKTLQFQSLKTSSSGITSLWNRAAYIVRADNSTTTWPYGELFPQTAVLGEHDTSLFGAGRVQFAVGYQRPTLSGVPDLWQALVDWGRPTFKAGWPNRYSYDGRHPNVAANRNQLWRKEAILYQASGVGGTDSTLRTSRQFFAKFSRPTGYQAEGRAVLLRLDDATRTGMQVLFYDPWIADAEGGLGVVLVERDTSLSDIEDITDVERLFRTMPFNASDSTTVGYMLYGKMFGDRNEGEGKSLSMIIELIDSATGEAVAQLDSISLSVDEDSIALQQERTLDLLTGTYYMTLRFGPEMPTPDTVEYDCLYPVTEVAGWVENPVSAKGVRRVAGEAAEGDVRISVQPNPFGSEIEIRFSIPSRDYVTLTVYNVLGESIAQLLDNVLVDRGRYGTLLSGDELPPGTYLVELRTTRGQKVVKAVRDR